MYEGQARRLHSNPPRAKVLMLGRRENRNLIQPVAERALILLRGERIMNEEITLFSSESVTEGHPDKVCDRIADSVLDAALAGDPMSRIACEVCCTTGLVVVMGEFTTETYIDIQKIAREAIRDIGYTDAAYGFDYKNCAVLTTIDEQSSDIAMGVNEALEAREGQSDIADSVGAGDQGMMFGYACRETDELMPLPITLAHRLTRRLAELRKSGEISYLRPDGKAQVTVAYDRNHNPMYVDAVVVSTQHDEGIDHADLTRDVIEKVIKAVIPADLLRPETKFYVNPTGSFVIGGPHGDSGVTGRKIIVDTYGGACPHGGGAFSGKDPTKVDRSACYYARYACKNIVAAGTCRPRSDAGCVRYRKSRTRFALRRHVRNLEVSGFGNSRGG